MFVRSCQKALGLFGIGGAVVAGLYDSSKKYPVLQPNSDVIVVGAGSSGALAGYELGHMMPGKKITVLDAGQGYEHANPFMSAWFYNWGSNGGAVSAFTEQGKPYPVTPSYHRGVGGAGSHNTSIAFMMAREQLEMFAKSLDMPVTDLKIATQVVLNMEPLAPAMMPGDSPWFDRSFATMVKHTGMKSTPGIDFSATVIPNTVGMVSMGAYPLPEKRDALRWCPALLLHDDLKPKNVTVIPGVEVERIGWSSDEGSGFARLWRKLTNAPLFASSLIIKKDDTTYRIPLGPDRDVLLANGALRLPELLQRSGVGPRDILEEAGVKPVIVNDRVGKGFDHSEIAVQAELAKEDVPWSGPMDWPAVGYIADPSKQSPTQFHFSISGPPYSSDPVVVFTPNVSDPDTEQGYQVRIKGPRLGDSFDLVHSDMTDGDRAALRHGVRTSIGLIKALQKEGLVGNIVEPPASVDVTNDKALDAWTFENLGTAFHWMGDARASKDPDSVFNEHFNLRDGRDGVIGNVWGTSAAVFPRAPWGNLHLTVQLYAVLASRKIAERRGQPMNGSIEWQRAFVDLEKSGGEFTIRRPGEESPNARPVANDYAKKWDAHEEK